MLSVYQALKVRYGYFFREKEVGKAKKWQGGMNSLPAINMTGNF